MPLNIKDERAHELARRLAAVTGESMTAAVRAALEERLARETRRRHGKVRAEELLAYRLSSVHNVTYTLDLMEQIRGALADGSFASLREVVAAQFSSAGAGR